MKILDRLFGQRKPSSRDVAKERLQLVLAYDRIKISPELLQILKNELITVISKHVEIDREGVDVTFSQGKRRSRLIADIPLLGTRGQRK
ncbi:MAG: cell division topological specificity factor MinE [Anaerolineae bacterium]